MNTDLRNQAKNQNVNEGIHLTVTTITRKKIENEEVPVVVIQIRKRRQRNPESIRKKTRGENEQEIKNLDTLNLQTGENPININDLDHLIDDK